MMFPGRLSRKEDEVNRLSNLVVDKFFGLGKFTRTNSAASSIIVLILFVLCRLTWM